MNFKRWKLGAAIAVITSILTGVVAWSSGMQWRAAAGLIAATFLKDFGLFSTKHPVDQISFDTATITKPTEPTNP